MWICPQKYNRIFYLKLPTSSNTGQGSQYNYNEGEIDKHSSWVSCSMNETKTIRLGSKYPFSVGPFIVRICTFLWSSIYVRFTIRRRIVWLSNAVEVCKTNWIWLNIDSCKIQSNSKIYHDISYEEIFLCIIKSRKRH